MIQAAIQRLIMVACWRSDGQLPRYDIIEEAMLDIQQRRHAAGQACDSRIPALNLGGRAAFIRAY